MQTIKAILKNKLAGAKRLAVLGVGSDLRSDDVAGMLVAEIFSKSLKRYTGPTKARVFFGSTAPENLTGEIKRFKPTHLVIADTAEVSEKPGTILVISPEQVGGSTFSTHLMPAHVLTNYFLKSFKCSITFIGIQPGSLRFGASISRQVQSAAKEVSKAIIDTIRHEV